MKNILITTVFALIASSALAQDTAEDSIGIDLKPKNLNGLISSVGSQMRDTVLDDLSDLDSNESTVANALSFFDSTSDKDPYIIEIKTVARDLKTQRALMIKIASLQNDLIDFARTDAIAAYQSRIPSSVCEYALETRFCNAMSASFRTEPTEFVTEITIEDLPKDVFKAE